VGETTFDTLLKVVNHVDFHAGGGEDKSDLAVLQHVQDLVQQDLFGFLHIKIDVFENEK
jgi:hypothetical protein